MNPACTRTSVVQPSCALWPQSLAALASNRYAIALLLLLWLKPDGAIANPTGESVAAGAAAIGRSGNTLTVRQATDRAIINWQSFSIGAGEITKFVQPGASSAVLNRVVSGNPSSLLGRLEANGKVFLINPNGVLVGRGAVIDTNGFVASTLNVRDSQFMAGGDLSFTGDSKARVQNLGTIRARGGDVYLIAQSVENAGAIDASAGTVGLAAGNEVLLKNSGDERLFVHTTIGQAAAGATGVLNSGVIDAVRAELTAAGGNMYALAVNNTGVVRAAGITELNGRVLLTSAGGHIENTGTLAAHDANGDGGTITIAAGAGAAAPSIVTSSGAIDVSGNALGAKGGEVTITGDQVALTANANVDASGDAGGGTVLLGGDYHGANAALHNADTAYVGPDARINADAVSSGDGGKVIVWSDHSTVFSGGISVRGGLQGGNGGFVETSGKYLQVSPGARVDASAANGQPGQWLLDPYNVRIVDFFTGTSNGSFSGGDPNTFTPSGNDATVDASTISSSLTNGTSVTITTSGAGVQAGDIRVDSNIFANVDKASATPVPTLRLDADNQIIVNAAIQGAIGSKGLNLTLNANDAISVTSQGSIFLVRNGIFTADKRPGSAGGITISGSINSLTSDNGATDRLMMRAAGNIAGTGSVQAVNLDLNSSAGSVSLGGSVGANTLTASAPAGSIVVNNATGVNVNFLGAISSGGAINIKNTGNGGSALNVVGDVAAGNGSALSITTGGTLFVDSSGAFGKGTGSITDATGTVTLTARDVSDGLNPAAPSINAAALALSAQQGIGSSTNALDTSVSNLEALTPAGGIFIKNAGKDLTIGGIPSFAVGGVLTGLTNGDQIQIVNDRTIGLTVGGTEKAHVAGPKDILIQANGTTSDVVIADSSPNAVNAHNGNVTLNAGRDVVVGAFARSGDVTGSTVNLNAGHAVVVDEGSTVTGAGSGGINATAGTVVPSTDGRPTSIVFFRTSAVGARFVTNGAPINLTTAPAGFVDLDSGASGGSLRTTLTAGLHGQINFNTDDVNVADVIDAGGPSGAFVNFATVSPGRPIDLGTDHPSLDPNYIAHTGTTALSLTNAELNNIHSSLVGVGQSTSGNLAVTAPIDIDAANFNQLFLNAGSASVANSLKSTNLTLFAQNNISGSGAFTTNNFQTASSLGAIALSGPLTIANASLIQAKGSIDFSSLSNRINAIGAVDRGGDFTVRNTLPLTLNDHISGSNTASDVTVRIVGDLTLAPGAHIVASGAHVITLEAFNGHFINNAGPDAGGPPAVDPQGGARFRIYSIDQNAPFKAGGLSAASFTNPTAVFPSDPVGGNVFYFSNAAQATPPVQAPGSSSGAGQFGQALSDDAQHALANAQAAYALQLQQFDQQEAQKRQALQRAEALLAEKSAALADARSKRAAAQAQLDAAQAVIDAANQEVETSELTLFGRYGISLPIHQEPQYFMSHQATLRASLERHMAAEGLSVSDASWQHLVDTTQHYLDTEAQAEAALARARALLAEADRGIDSTQADISNLQAQVAANQPGHAPVFVPPPVDQRALQLKQYELEEGQRRDVVKQATDALAVEQANLQNLQGDLASEQARKDDVRSKLDLATQQVEAKMLTRFGKYGITLPMGQEAEYLLSHQNQLHASFTKKAAAAGDGVMSETIWRGLVEVAQEYLDTKQQALAFLAERDAAINDDNQRIAAEQARIAELNARIAANQPRPVPSVVVAGSAAVNANWGPDDAK